MRWFAAARQGARAETGENGAAVAFGKRKAIARPQKETRPARVTAGSGVARRTPQSWPLASRSAPFEGIGALCALAARPPLRKGKRD